MLRKNSQFPVLLTLCLLPTFSIRLHFACVNAFTVIIYSVNVYQMLVMCWLLNSAWPVLCGAG